MTVVLILIICGDVLYVKNGLFSLLMGFSHVKECIDYNFKQRMKPIHSYYSVIIS